MLRGAASAVTIRTPTLAAPSRVGNEGASRHGFLLSRSAVLACGLQMDGSRIPIPFGPCGFHLDELAWRSQGPALRDAPVNCTHVGVVSAYPLYEADSS